MADLHWSLVSEGWLRLSSVMTPAERGDLDRLAVPAARLSQACSYVMRRHVLGHLLQREPSRIALSHRCARCGSHEHGQPVVEDVSCAQRRAISVSHCATHVGLATSSAPVGLDIEIDQPDRVWRSVDSLAAHHDDDIAGPLHRWTGKEAVLKLLGVGLALPMTAVCIRGDEWSVHAGDEVVGPRAGAVSWHVLGEGTLAALATVASEPRAVVAWHPPA